jgi:hypothetical protein
MDELEPGSLRLPVLMQIHQAKCLVAFNACPLFNNAIDDLMYIKLHYTRQYHETCYGVNFK